MQEPGWGWGEELDWGQFLKDLPSMLCYLPKQSPAVVVSRAGPVQQTKWGCPLWLLGAQPALTESQVWVRHPAGLGVQSHALSATVHGTYSL